MPPGVPVAVTKRTTSVIRPAALLAGSPAVFPAEAQVYKDYGMWHETWGFGPMLFGVLMMIIFWAAIFALAALLVRWIAGWGTQREQPPLKSSAVEILEERFAAEKSISRNSRTGVACSPARPTSNAQLEVRIGERGL